MVSRAPFGTTPTEARRSVCTVTLMGPGAAPPLKGLPRLRRGPLRPLITRSWDFYAETADTGEGLINQPGTRWLDDRNTPRS
jgi:hypothetical protein